MKKDKGHKKDTRELIVTGVSFVFGTFCLALCYNLFLVPNDIVIGGMSGLSIIVHKLTGFDSETFIYLSNFVLLIVSYLFLGKDETQRVLIGTFLYPLLITFTNPIAHFLLHYINFEEILITVILASIMYGISNGLIYKFGYSTGGGDVLVRLLCKYFHLSEGKGVVICNIFIIIAGAFVFGIDKAVYAVIIVVIGSLLVDKISIGISNSKKFMIYTRESKKVRKVIEEEVKTGYTIFPTVGGYSHVKGAMIMCVIRNRDVNLFKAKILEIDPTAFFVINDCYEVQGGVKRSNLPFM